MKMVAAQNRRGQTSRTPFEARGLAASRSAQHDCAVQFNVGAFSKNCVLTGWMPFVAVSPRRSEHLGRRRGAESALRGRRKCCFQFSGKKGKAASSKLAARLEYSVVEGWLIAIPPFVGLAPVRKGRAKQRTALMQPVRRDRNGAV